MTTSNQAPELKSRERLLERLPITERRLPVAGVSTAVLEGGAGPPMVLLHGPGESSIWWLRAIPDLVTTHRVVAPDFPGHGDSEGSDETMTPEGVFAWLDELIEDTCPTPPNTCPTPPILVGHALGGAIAARFAIDHGDRLERLVLVDSLGLGKFRPSARFAFGLVRFLVRPTERSYRTFFGQCMLDRETVIEEMGEDWEPFKDYYLASIRTPSVKAAMRTLMKSVGTPPIPPADLERVAVPTSLIWGRDDRAVRLGVAEAASARYGWPLHVIEGARDDPKLEQPEAFVDAPSATLERESVAQPVS